MSTHRFFVLGNQSIRETTVRLEPGAFVQIRHMDGLVRFNASSDGGTEVA